MTRQQLLGGVTAAMLALGGIASAEAATFDFRFDDTPTGLIDSTVVGTGTFSFDGPATTGTFALTSLANYAFNFTFGSSTFTNTAIATPLANISILISTAGPDLVMRFGGAGGGPFGGSLDFVSADSLSFQPDFGTLYIVLGQRVLGDYLGVESARVPEPMALGLFGLGLAGLAALRRRA